MKMFEKLFPYSKKIYFFWFLAIIFSIIQAIWFDIRIPIQFFMILTVLISPLILFLVRAQKKAGQEVSFYIPILILSFLGTLLSVLVIFAMIFKLPIF